MSRRTKIHLAPNLIFDTDIITRVIGIVAKRDAGKTYTATKLAEGMLLIKAQIVAIDPVGNWYGLRLGANGKPEGGLDIKILGGRNGDIPLEYTAGALIAKTIVESGMSFILDLSMMRKAHQERFATDFAVAMLEERKRDPAAMHIFFEEAYRFFPQKLTKGSKSALLEATEELITMGYTDNMIVALFRKPFYMGLNPLYRNRGEEFVRDFVSKCRGSLADRGAYPR